MQRANQRKRTSRNASGSRDLMMGEHIQIGERTIGPGHPVYVIAEISANHNGSFENALRLIELAKECGADAVKLQTYTADTITLSCDREEFRIQANTQWDGKTLHSLYSEAFTPWDWQPKLKLAADALKLDLFSSPFDDTAVRFLEQMNVPAYKLASCELVDLPLIGQIAATGKPLIISTGMASVEEIEEALTHARQNGAKQIALLKCTSSYPADPSEMNLLAITQLRNRFQLPVGLSDHSCELAVPVAAVALGACIIEKHLIAKRSDGGPDSAFSLEPGEFKQMVSAVRVAEQALGEGVIGPSARETKSRVFRRSLFVTDNVKRGELFSSANVRSVRPSNGLHTRHLPQILGRRAARDVKKGTPLTWELLEQA